MLQKMGYPDDWEIGGLLDSTFMTLKKEAKNENSALFRHFTSIGRLQVLETELISYKLVKGEISKAAQIAVRMLYEDEFIFPDAQLKAVEALVAYLDVMEQDESTLERTRCELEVFQKLLLQVVDDIDNTRFSVATEQSEELAVLKKSMEVRESLGSQSVRLSMKETRRGDIIMEFNLEWRLGFEINFES